jgi:hypothetical protein
MYNIITQESIVNFIGVVAEMVIASMIIIKSFIGIKKMKPKGVVKFEKR